MITRWHLARTFLATAIVFGGVQTARADDQAPKEQQGVVVEPRGPIHEAFAQPTQRKPEPTPVVPKKPPPDVPEEPPDQKPNGSNVQWIPGYWAWDAAKNDYIWVSGVWRDMPPNRKWTPGHWTEASGGWQFVPGYWAGANQTGLSYLPQPPETIDVGPSSPAPNDDSFYVPGNWVYRNSAYVWRPGFWNAAYANWVWTPGCYHWTPAGYVYVNGYWDYPLESRGLLFAPVSFNFAWWSRPGWYYRPWFGIGLGGHYGSLYVNPYWGSYYYGNYGGGLYVGLGYHPWHWWGAHYHDPLYGHYHWHNHGHPGWSGAHLAARPRPTPYTALNRMPAVAHTSAAQSAAARASAQRYHAVASQRHEFERGSAGAHHSVSAHHSASPQSFHGAAQHHAAGSMHFSHSPSPHFAHASGGHGGGGQGGGHPAGHGGGGHGHH
jgi:hypothetical protein